MTEFNYQMVNPIKIEVQYIGFIEKQADYCKYPNNRQGRRLKAKDKKRDYDGY